MKVIPLKNAPVEVIELFNRMWDIDGGGVLSIKGAEIYKDIKSRGYWVSNTCGEFKLNKITKEQSERIQWRRDHPSMNGVTFSMAFDR